MSMIFKGSGTQSGELPVPVDRALEYFKDVKSFILKIEDVKTVKDLAKPNAYLLTQHPLGGLNYYTVIVGALEAEFTDTGLRIKPLDFDETKIVAEHPVLKAYIEGELIATPLGPDTTKMDFTLTFTVDFPVPGALRFVPPPLIKLTADGLMSLKMNSTIANMYKKVIDDFNLPV